jgi:hypothetical protein
MSAAARQVFLFFPILPSYTDDAPMTPIESIRFQNRADGNGREAGWLWIQT